MSKFVVYILDKIVWILLIGAVTTQALQIAGVVDTPRGLGHITYKQDNEYNFQVQVDGNEMRGKRQADQDRNQFIDTLFNIPISTLRAVNNLIQNSRPAFRSIRDFALKRFDKSNKGQTAAVDQVKAASQRLFPVYVRPNEDSGRQ